MIKKRIIINYDIRKTPLLLIWACGLFFSILINLTIFFVSNNFYVISTSVPIILTFLLIYNFDILVLEYKVLKWYEKNIFIRHKNQDSQILKNQKIILEKDKEQYKISFKRMGYFNEEQIEKFALLLNDFIKNYEYHAIAPDGKHYNIIYRPQRTRINLNETPIFDLIFPDKSGYRIDSSLSIPFHHHLIVGASGKGKSYLIQNFYYPLLSEVGEIHIIDIKNTTPQEWRSNYTSDIETGLKALKNAKEEMDRRYQSENLNETPYFLVFEEVQAFKTALDKEQSKDFEKDLKTILVKGREAKVFIFFISQFANVGAGGVFADSGTRAQFYTRINVGYPNQQQCEQIFNCSRSMLPPRLNNKIGTGYIQIDDKINFVELPTKERGKKNEKNRFSELQKRLSK